MLAAEPDLWMPLLWTGEDVRQQSDQELAAALSKLTTATAAPVLLVDDFGDLLTTTQGKRLEQKLFAMVNSGNSDVEALRCVLVTAPRDRNIQVPGSALRERCKVAFPPRRNDPRTDGRFGLSSEAEIRDFCGGTHLLAPGGVSEPNAERGIALRLGKENATRWVGQLRMDHHQRLSDIARRPSSSPSSWRTGQLDEALVPMVIEDADAKCHLIDAVLPEHLLGVLVTEQWPDRSPYVSIERFIARCSNEPNPRWIDNFLSDNSVLKISNVAFFLSKVLDALGGRTLQILSRSPIGDIGSTPAQLARALRSAGITPDEEERIEWRMYDKRDVGNLHDRQLLLPGRTEAFKLPPATVVVGQSPPGNESDAELPVRDHASAKQAWAHAKPIW